MELIEVQTGKLHGDLDQNMKKKDEQQAGSTFTEQNRAAAARREPVKNSAPVSRAEAHFLLGLPEPSSPWCLLLPLHQGV